MEDTENMSLAAYRYQFEVLHRYLGWNNPVSIGITRQCVENPITGLNLGLEQVPCNKKVSCGLFFSLFFFYTTSSDLDSKKFIDKVRCDLPPYMTGDPCARSFECSAFCAARYMWYLSFSRKMLGEKKKRKGALVHYI